MAQRQARWALGAAAVAALALVTACSGSSAPRTTSAPPSPAATSAPAPGTTAAAPATSGGEQRAPSSTGSGFVPSLKDAPNDHPSWYTAVCQRTQNEITPHTCTFGDTTHPVLTVAMVGDSTDAQWIGAVVAIAKARHWKVVTDFHSRCYWTATMLVNSGHTDPYTSCYQWGKDVMSDLLNKIKPNVVLTTARPVLGTPQHPPGPAAFAQIASGAATYWRTLIKHHIRVVGMHESPEMGIDIPTCLAHHARSACNVPAAKAITKNPPTALAAGLVPASHLVSLNAVICPSGVCTATYGNIVKFRDVHHLTATYVEFIEPQIRQRLLATKAFK